MRDLCALVLLGLTLAGPAWAQAPDSAPQPGQTVWVGEAWFRFLGDDGQGHGLWSYPHLEGVIEVFRSDDPEGGPGSKPWRGDLGSRYDANKGVFHQRFRAVELLNVLLASNDTARQRRAARLLQLFCELQPAAAEDLPCYLRSHTGRIARRLTEQDREATAEVIAARVGLTARFGPLGPEVMPAAGPLDGARDHYQALAADGYLDLTIVGGNSRDGQIGRTYSPMIFQELMEKLQVEGAFRAQSFVGQGPTYLLERTIRMFNRRVRVRALVLQSQAEPAGIRRGVAAFVEGLAHADVFLYLGHSNGDSGAYYVSETRSRYSRFQVGPDLRTADELEDALPEGDPNREGDRVEEVEGEPDPTALALRAHLLGRRRYQFVILMSCSSYPKYVQPFQLTVQELGGRSPGLMGTPEICTFLDFVPRTYDFVDRLLRTRGPREIISRQQRIRPHPMTPSLVVRGFLQPRGTFLVPEGVTVEDVVELGAEQAHLVAAAGSDEGTYYSTCVFPQDELGEVVTVVEGVDYEEGLYGVYKSGQVWRVGAETHGAAARVTALDEVRVGFLTRAARPGRDPALVGIDQSGRQLFALEKGKLRELRWKPPRGVQFVALGNDAEERFLALAKDGRAYLRKGGRWRPLDETPRLTTLGVSLAIPQGVQGHATLVRASTITPRARRTAKK